MQYIKTTAPATGAVAAYCSYYKKTSVFTELLQLLNASSPHGIKGYFVSPYQTPY
jgi:hypothetical protein